MTKRNYPLFLIDRSKNENYPFDYITCMDREAGFVARVINLHTNELLREFIDKIAQIEGSDYTSFIMRHNVGGTILVIEDFLYHFEPTDPIKTRIKALMKKAIKKYFFATVDREPSGKDCGIDTLKRYKQMTQDFARMFN